MFVVRRGGGGCSRGTRAEDAVGVTLRQGWKQAYFFIALHFILPPCWAIWFGEGYHDTLHDQPASVWTKVRIWTRGGLPGPEAFVVPDLEGKDCAQGTRSELSRMKPSPCLGLLWLS